MFERLYTTKMSADKKSLQKRFTKIRSKSGRISRLMAIFMSVAVLLTIACATVVMAAVGTDGLEYWNKNEIYFLAGLQGTITTDIDAMPDWVNDISSDGKINIFIKRVDFRATTGLVTHKRVVNLSGNVGEADFEQTSTCGYRNENGESILLFFGTTESVQNPYGEIQTDNTYISFSNEDLEASGNDFEYFINKISQNNEKFIKVQNIKEIGDFVKIENMYWNGIGVNYYTYYENTYKNKVVDGITIETVSANEDYISVIPKIEIPEASNIEVFICEPESIARISRVKSHSLSDYNYKEIKIENIFPEKKYERDKTYVINSVVSDKNDNVIYRQQDKITIP